MPTVGSGQISFSNIVAEFGSSFAQASNWYGSALNVPTTGAFSISNMYSKSASAPGIIALTTSNIDTHNTARNGTWELSNNVTDTYGKPLTYSIATYNSSHFTSASVTGSKLSYNIPSNKFALNTPVDVKVVNRFGRSNTISPTFKVTGAPITSVSLGSTTLSDNTTYINLSSYFTDNSGTGLGYWRFSDPKNNATISGTQLAIAGNNRGTSYTVTVGASNSYNQTALSSISVTECNPPFSSGGVKSTYLTDTYHTFYSSGTFTVNGSVSYYAWIIGGGGAGGDYAGGGGGAGGCRAISGTLAAGSYSVIVGAGGVGYETFTRYNSRGDNGGDSFFNGWTASGGGGGGGWNQSNGATGGCGGGGNMNSNAPGGGGSLGWGGAAGVWGNNTNACGGGGGGMSGAGGNTYPNPYGGSGTTVVWGGSNVAVCGGGGGGTQHSTTGGSGGSGGGGAGGAYSQPGQNGTGYGSGGGGMGYYTGNKVGFGGPGIVVIRYVTP